MSRFDCDRELDRDGFLWYCLEKSADSQQSRAARLILVEARADTRKVAKLTTTTTRADHPLVRQAGMEGQDRHIRRVNTQRHTGQAFQPTILRGSSIQISNRPKLVTRGF